jgi:hypothetical protein
LSKTDFLQTAAIEENDHQATKKKETKLLWLSAVETLAHLNIARISACTLI